MSKNHAESKTSKGTQETYQPYIDANSQGGIEVASRTDGSFPVGTGGAARAQRNTVDPITGGILSQLIDQVKSQLAEAEECVEWYERKKTEYRGQLDRLEHLHRLMEEEFTD